MNIVILSKNFWPWKNAEAYCATRFASALADEGHVVHVVTGERPESDFENSYDVLLNPSIKITRVPVPLSHFGRIPRCSLRYFAIGANDASSYPLFINALKEVLLSYDKPILMSRTFPISSMYIAWHCRKYAYRWIAHFSDPLHWQPPASRLEQLQRLSNSFWLRRTFLCADAISVTCTRAARYYKEKFGSLAQGQRWILSTHIGDNKLAPSNIREFQTEANVIAHYGDMYAGRGHEILDAIEALNNEGVSCDFVQDRDPLDGDIKVRCLEKSYFHISDKALSSSAKVSVVLDFTVDLPYSPFLMSKFVYQIYEDRPIVVVAKRDSAKHDYCAQFPEAGLFFAEQGNLTSIKEALVLAMSADEGKFDRRRIRERFSAHSIAHEFEEGIDALERG